MNFQESSVFEHKRAQAPLEVSLSSILPERQAVSSAGIDRLEALSIIAASATSLVPVDSSLISSSGSRWSLASQQGGADEGRGSPAAQEEGAPQPHLKPDGGWPSTSFQGDQRKEDSLRFRCADEDDGPSSYPNKNSYTYASYPNSSCISGDDDDDDESFRSHDNSSFFEGTSGVSQRGRERAGRGRGGRSGRSGRSGGRGGKGRGGGKGGEGKKSTGFGADGSSAIKPSSTSSPSSSATTSQRCLACIGRHRPHSCGKMLLSGRVRNRKRERNASTALTTEGTMASSWVAGTAGKKMANGAFGSGGGGTSGTAKKKLKPNFTVLDSSSSSSSSLPAALLRNFRNFSQQQQQQQQHGPFSHHLLDQRKRDSGGGANISIAQQRDMATMTTTTTTTINKDKNSGDIERRPTSFNAAVHNNHHSKEKRKDNRTTHVFADAVAVNDGGGDGGGAKDEDDSETGCQGEKRGGVRGVGVRGEYYYYDDVHENDGDDDDDYDSERQDAATMMMHLAATCDAKTEKRDPYKMTSSSTSSYDGGGNTDSFIQCELCGSAHKGSHGSGRFCSSACHAKTANKIRNQRWPQTQATGQQQQQQCITAVADTSDVSEQISAENNMFGDGGTAARSAAESALLATIAAASAPSSLDGADASPQWMIMNSTSLTSSIQLLYRLPDPSSPTLPPPVCALTPEDSSLLRQLQRDGRFPSLLVANSSSSISSISSSSSSSSNSTFTAVVNPNNSSSNTALPPPIPPPDSAFCSSLMPSSTLPLPPPLASALPLASVSSLSSLPSSLSPESRIQRQSVGHDRLFSFAAAVAPSAAAANVVAVAAAAAAAAAPSRITILGKDFYHRQQQQQQQQQSIVPTHQSLQPRSGQDHDDDQISSRGSGVGVSGVSGSLHASKAMPTMMPTTDKLRVPAAVLKTAPPQAETAAVAAVAAAAMAALETNTLPKSRGGYGGQGGSNDTNQHNLNHRQTQYQLQVQHPGSNFSLEQERHIQEQQQMLQLQHCQEQATLDDQYQQQLRQRYIQQQQQQVFFQEQHQLKQQAQREIITFPQPRMPPPSSLASLPPSFPSSSSSYNSNNDSSDRENQERQLLDQQSRLGGLRQLYEYQYQQKLLLQYQLQKRKEQGQQPQHEGARFLNDIYAQYSNQQQQDQLQNQQQQQQQQLQSQPRFQPKSQVRPQEAAPLQQSQQVSLQPQPRQPAMPKPKKSKTKILFQCIGKPAVSFRFAMDLNSCDPHHAVRFNQVLLVDEVSKDGKWVRMTLPKLEGLKTAPLARPTSPPCAGPNNACTKTATATAITAKMSSGASTDATSVIAADVDRSPAAAAGVAVNNIIVRVVIEDDAAGSTQQATNQPAAGELPVGGDFGGLCSGDYPAKSIVGNTIGSDNSGGNKNNTRAATMMVHDSEVPGAADDDGGTIESVDDARKLASAAEEHSAAPPKYLCRKWSGCGHANAVRYLPLKINGRKVLEQVAVDGGSGDENDNEEREEEEEEEENDDDSEGTDDIETECQVQQSSSVDILSTGSALGATSCATPGGTSTGVTAGIFGVATGFDGTVHMVVNASNMAPSLSALLHKVTEEEDIGEGKDSASGAGDQSAYEWIRTSFQALQISEQSSTSTVLRKSVSTPTWTVAKEMDGVSGEELSEELAVVVEASHNPSRHGDCGELTKIVSEYGGENKEGGDREGSLKEETEACKLTVALAELRAMPLDSDSGVLDVRPDEQRLRALTSTASMAVTSHGGTYGCTYGGTYGDIYSGIDGEVAYGHAHSFSSSFNSNDTSPFVHPKQRQKKQQRGREGRQHGQPQRQRLAAPPPPSNVVKRGSGGTVSSRGFNCSLGAASNVLSLALASRGGQSSSDGAGYWAVGDSNSGCAVGDGGCGRAAVTSSTTTTTTTKRKPSAATAAAAAAAVVWKPFKCPIEHCAKIYTQERKCSKHTDALCTAAIAIINATTTTTATEITTDSRPLFKVVEEWLETFKPNGDAYNEHSVNERPVAIPFKQPLLSSSSPLSLLSAPLVCSSFSSFSSVDKEAACLLVDTNRQQTSSSSVVVDDEDGKLEGGETDKGSEATFDAPFFSLETNGQHHDFDDNREREEEDDENDDEANDVDNGALDGSDDADDHKSADEDDDHKSTDDDDPDDDDDEVNEDESEKAKDNEEGGMESMRSAMEVMHETTKAVVGVIRTDATATVLEPALESTTSESITPAASESGSISKSSSSSLSSLPSSPRGPKEHKECQNSSSMGTAGMPPPYNLKETAIPKKKDEEQEEEKIKEQGGVKRKKREEWADDMARRALVMGWAAAADGGGAAKAKRLVAATTQKKSSNGSSGGHAHSTIAAVATTTSAACMGSGCHFNSNPPSAAAAAAGTEGGGEEVLKTAMKITTTKKFEEEEEEEEDDEEEGCCAVEAGVELPPYEFLDDQQRLVEAEALVGRKVRKFFPGYGTFEGEVLSFVSAHAPSKKDAMVSKKDTSSSSSSIFQVEYEDGDTEEMHRDSLAKILLEVAKHKSQKRVDTKNTWNS